MFDVDMDLSEFEAGFRASFKRLGQGVAASVEPAVLEGASEARTTARFKDRSGEARRRTEGVLLSMGVGQDGAKGQLRCLVPYASVLNGGSPPHEIRPKAGRGFVGPVRKGQSRGSRAARSVLSWTGSDGLQHFAAVVHHPGTSPDGFMDRGAAACERRLQAGVDEAVERFEQDVSR